MMRAATRTLGLALALAACGAPAPTPAPQATPAALPSAPPDEHAARHEQEHALHAQEHEISQELAVPAIDHRARGHHRHHRFERADEWAQQFDSPERDAWQRPDAVLAALALRPDMTVADIGAGTGYFTVRLARAAPRGRVLAVDLEPDMVRYLGERAAREGLTNVTAIQGEATDPKLGEPVDVALVVDTYHHISDPTRFFARVRDALRPGGTLAIVDFKKDAPDDAPGPPAAMRIADEIVAAHLAKLGFHHVRTDRDALPYQYIVLLRRD
ncbi:MAG: class I SAM-dependent methyltransferase [Myxococcales bacterium]|nr:class I SAM-dependent methyltransferase [Myxococcales bacterium]